MIMFELPSKSRYFNTDHKKELESLLSEKATDLNKTENDRLQLELSYVEKYDLYSFFLLLYEITNLLLSAGIKFCAAEDLASSYIAHILGINLANPLDFNLESDEYYELFEACPLEDIFLDADIRKFNEKRLAAKKMTKESFDRICCGVYVCNIFIVSYEDIYRIEKLLSRHFGTGNVANPLRSTRVHKAAMGYSYHYTDSRIFAFLPDNVCQEHKIGINFNARFPSIDCADLKCGIYGIPTVSFLSYDGFTKDIDLTDKATLLKVITIDDDIKDPPNN